MKYPILLALSFSAFAQPDSYYELLPRRVEEKPTLPAYEPIANKPFWPEPTKAAKAQISEDLKNNKSLSPEAREALINIIGNSGAAPEGCTEEIVNGRKTYQCPDGTYVKDPSVNNSSALKIIEEAKKAKAKYEADKKGNAQ